MSEIWTPSEAIEAYSVARQNQPKRESRAFKMGKMAYQCGNSDNFYEPGTRAYKEWQKGYEAESAKWAAAAPVVAGWTVRDRAVFCFQ